MNSTYISKNWGNTAFLVNIENIIRGITESFSAIRNLNDLMLCPTEKQKRALLEGIGVMCQIFWGPNPDLCEKVMQGDFFSPFKVLNSELNYNPSEALEKIKIIIGNYSDQNSFLVNCKFCANILPHCRYWAKKTKHNKYVIKFNRLISILLLIYLMNKIDQHLWIDHSDWHLASKPSKFWSALNRFSSCIGHAIENLREKALT